MTASIIERPPEKIAQRCTEAFGQDRVLMAIGEHYRIADESQRVVALPHSIEELSEMLRFAASERMCVIPAGAGTWLEMGNRPVRAHLVISTAQMKRVLEYEPADLTATLEAGCALAEFNARAAEHNQRIPLDPFGHTQSTIGAIVATASHGPLRCAFGTPRDWVVGMRVAHIDGRITKAGGKVVKNVAGYDLCKLYTGSFGTLGIIGEISFKLRALPATERTMFFFGQDAARLCALAARLMNSDVQPAAMELFSLKFDGLRLEYGEGRFTLALRFISEPETIDAQIVEASRLGREFRQTVLSDDEARDFWRDYYEDESAEDWDIILRVSVLPSDTAMMIAEIGSTIPQAALRVHAGNGIIRVQAKSHTLAEFKKRQRPLRLAELRQHTHLRGGQMIILRLPPELKNQLDAWGDPGQTAPLMQALKKKFDPQSLLNPGRFVAGI
ncbi:MAG TPA: FAD-binding oxidoreductase [Blastocatellia bacterium]|nr:FAD-binding oxidoreductase [Blastocatellia bacterium]